MALEIVKGFPPNYNAIKVAGFGEKTTVYCFGSKIYNPSGVEIPPDIEFHELQHSKQQGETPEIWWSRYLFDPVFRLEEELIAFAHQYHLVKSVYPTNVHKEALYEMADTLSTKYKLPLSHLEAENLIRGREKTL